MRSAKSQSGGRASQPPESEGPARLMVSKAESALLIASARGAGSAAPRAAQALQTMSRRGADSLIPLGDHFATMRRLTESSRDETLHLSKRPLAPGTTDFVIGTLVHATDFEDAMKRTAKAYNLMHGGYYNRVSRRRDGLVYAINDRDFPYAFDTLSAAPYALMEGLLIFLHALLSLSVGEALTGRLRGVRTRRPNRTEPDGLLGFWQAPVRCGAEVYALEYDIAATGLLVRDWRGAPPNSVAVYDLIDTLIAERERSGLGKTIEARVLDAVAEGVDNQGDVARRLGVSIATLRRRLTDAGVTFRDLRARALHDAASSMLAQGRPVGDVAEALGYVDIRSFSRAFKAWSGTTPKAFAGRTQPRR